MKANPGGHLDPSEVVGRSGLIDGIWRALERQSVVLTAERRMGKTCVVKKMVAERRPNTLPLYRDLEHVRQPVEFAKVAFEDIEAHLGTRSRIAHRARQAWRALGGTEIAGVFKLPEGGAAGWKELLTSAVQDLVGDQDDRVVLFWDEMPLMIDNIAEHAGKPAAMETLDVLRSLRQQHPGLRMVFTGSIGLHNVIRSLRQSGYGNDPTNDMQTIDVPPLEDSDARGLACALLDGEGLHSDDLEQLSRAICAQTDCIPFYIHQVVDSLVGLHGRPVNAADVEKCIAARLVDPADPWHLSYIRDRLDTHYGAGEVPLLLSILDALAVADAPLSFGRLVSLVNSSGCVAKDEQVRSAVSALRSDHYLSLDAEKGLAFCFGLLKRWWRLQRSLAG